MEVPFLSIPSGQNRQKVLSIIMTNKEKFEY